MRRQFMLPEADNTFLGTLGLPWETIVENNARWLILHDYEPPEGYNHSRVFLGIRISPGYPDTQLDMVYFSPPIARLDGRVIGALSTTTLDGKTYQQWSRHRTGLNPWRPGEDDLSSHLELVEHWLERELRKN
jgi:hypothetical protein